ncbi:MAG: sulfatase-like hydrolase/transferase [Clostridiaceae bacterium]|nr:sulfatase-like hydrolase/transferase [Clostridiaceae bacterium]
MDCRRTAILKRKSKVKPNVIFVFVDDLGIGDVSCFNPESQIQTPNIDALARRGMRFTDSHATSAVCTPSRYGLLTGRYNWRSRLKQGVLMGEGTPLIEPGRMTMANVFKKAGYFTACIGKWHLGMGWQKLESIDGSMYGAEDEIEAWKQADTQPEQGRRRAVLDTVGIDFTKPTLSGPRSYGFDYFYGLNASLDQPPYTYIENEKVTKVPDHLSGVWPLDRGGPTMQQQWQRGPTASGFHPRDVLPHLQNKLLELIEIHANEPFFLYYPTPAVHGPLLPLPEFEGKSGLNLYGDVVLQLDAMVGEITAKLKELGIWDNTIVVFTSDNGCSGVADYPLLNSLGHDPSCGYRGKKADIWEGGHREPTIVSWPKKFAEAISCGEMVCHSDFFRTFAEILSVDVPENAAEDSVSVLPLLEGGCRPVREHIIHHSGAGFFSIREGNWKLELCAHNGGPLSGAMGYVSVEPTCSEEIPYQLYDLEADPGERKNLAAENKDLIVRMKANLLRLIEAGRSTPGIPQQNTVETWRQLEELKN